MTSLKEKLIKIGAKLVTHGRYVAFQMAEVAIPLNLFGDILRLIAELRPPPDPACVMRSIVMRSSDPTGELRPDDGKINNYWRRTGRTHEERPVYL
jgi:hypothetical protein